VRSSLLLLQLDVESAHAAVTFLKTSSMITTSQHAKLIIDASRVELGD
jgi:hypothetical protein